jgi:hypothetical protein
MSLFDLRAMRMARLKPPHVLSVVVGDVGPVHKGASDVIALPAGCQPKLLDWRPTVGLWTNFYLLSNDWTAMDAALDAAATAGAKLMGFACAHRVGALCQFDEVGDQQKLERLLWEKLEDLCK